MDLINKWCEDEAITRRLTHVEVTTPMFVQQNNFYINLNIQESEKKYFLMKSEIIKDNSLYSSKNFRIYSNCLFLTYSRTDLAPVEALSQLQEKFSHISKYVVSQEEHVDEPEKGKHLHVFLEFNKKTNILSCKKLDLVDKFKKKLL
jgi:hypothetical protein